MAAPQPIQKGNLTGLTIQTESGRIEVSDRIRSTDVYRGPQSLQIIIPNRGTFGTGARLGWIVSSACYEPEKGGVFKYTINWEAGGAASGLTPPNTEIDLQPQELYPKVERNKFFNGIAPQTIALAYDTVMGGTPAAKAAAQTAILALAQPQQNLGLALAAKLQQGEETYYIAGWRYTVTLYSFVTPAVTRGGFLQVPTTQPTVGYFDAGTNWLRLADQLSSVGPIGGMWKVVQTWLGGPNGHWDSDLYS